MIKKKVFILCLAFGLTSILTAKAQTKFEVPENVKLTEKDDYTKYESKVIEAAKWLEETDLNKETDKRQYVNAFVLQWVSGSPTVSIDINEKLGQIYGKNVELLGLYLASYTRHFLENKTTATKFSATKAALLSIMTVYKKGIKITKNKEMDKLIKSTDENKLDDYIKDNFK